VQYSEDGQSPDIADLGPGAIPRFRSFSGNDFYGNDRNRPLLQLSVFALGLNPTYNPGPSAHCGVLNVGALNGPIIQGVLGPAITLNATDNFWGSSGGPSASGPGDAAGGACDQNNATTTARPFAAAVL
jgi:hypothetical protein